MKETFLFESYAEFRPALMMPNEQRIANFSKVFFDCSSAAARVSLIFPMAYC
jgi:hypothetical protein